MTHVTPDDVLHFVPDLDLTGSRDESERLKAAHDSAAARGYRDLFIEGPVLAPGLAAVGQVLFRTRTGAGRLIGTYRKRVIPLSAPPARLPSGIHPRRHLPRFLSAMAKASAERPATIALLSDSWGMPNQRIAPTSAFVGALMRRLRQEFGPAARHVRLQNHAVGATRLLEAAPPARSSGRR
jgi:hypothetical protein